LPDGFDRSSWDPHVERLTFLVHGVSEEARKRAIRRLEKIFGIGALTTEEEAAFGAALWSKVEPASGLPSQTEYSATAFLSLPHPPNVDVESIVRAHLMTRDFPRVVVGDGAVMPRGQDMLARELRGGNTPLIAMTEEEWRAYTVGWTAEEAKAMLHKLSGLWDGEKEVLRSYLGSDFALPSHDLADRFIDWVRLLAEVILPRLAEADGATKDLAHNLIMELDEAGAHVSYAAPALLYLDDGQIEETTGQLWDGMGAQDPRRVGEAIRGVVLWLVFHARGGPIPPPPDHPLDELVNRIIARKMPGLKLALIHFTNLLRLHPEQLETRHLDGVCTALRYLIEDTRLPDTQEQRDVDGVAPSPILIGDRPEYRYLSASLASYLSARYIDLGQAQPEILTSWRDVSRDATLPEIKRAWIESGE
jgi:hypothetical protein